MTDKTKMQDDLKSVLSDRTVDEAVYGISEIMARDICEIIQPIVQKRCELFLDVVRQSVQDRYEELKKESEKNG